MKQSVFILLLMLLMVACTSRNGLNDANNRDADSLIVTDSMRPDSLYHPSPDDFMDGDMLLHKTHSEADEQCIDACCGGHGQH